MGTSGAWKSRASLRACSVLPKCFVHCGAKFRRLPQPAGAPRSAQFGASGRRQLIVAKSARGAGDHPVAAEILGSVQDVVRRAQQVLHVGEALVAALGGHAGREGDEQRAAFQLGHRGGDDVGQHPADHVQCHGFAGIGQQCDEFLATETGHGVAVAQLALQLAGEGAQHLIAGQVAMRVVDLLEIVQVDERHRQRPALAAGTQELLLKHRFQLAAVEHAGQRVAMGLVGQALGPGFEFVGAAARLVGILQFAQASSARPRTGWRCPAGPR
ncbi:hypothetical protein G6F65_013271 [Rhizopus arrhizus]|nr:hypothetical protein G6F65_013271 [Rhizopus arrhizus]